MRRCFMKLRCEFVYGDCGSSNQRERVGHVGSSGPVEGHRPGIGAAAENESAGHDAVALVYSGRRNRYRHGCRVGRIGRADKAGGGLRCHT